MHEPVLQVWDGNAGYPVQIKKRKIQKYKKNSNEEVGTEDL